MADVERRTNYDTDWSTNSQQELEEIQRSWILRPQDRNKKKKYVDFGYIMCSYSFLKWTIGSLLVAFLVIGLPIVVSRNVGRHRDHRRPGDDEFSEALKTALLFFDAQKSGRLPKDNPVDWRGDSGLNDGASDGVKLVGGYYDAGNNIKYHFPMAFSMTMLSWSVIEYSHKYKAINEYHHVRELIKWGTDYILISFKQTVNSTDINTIYSQVGGSRNQSTNPDDLTCWERPEDMDYPRPVQTASQAPDLAAEMAAALASASIVFRDNVAYSKKLVDAATALYDFAIRKDQTQSYSKGNPSIEPYYNSTGYFDEHIWGAAWMFLATGNRTRYLVRATDHGLAEKANVFHRTPRRSVLSWDNKMPAAELLLTRIRLFLNLGFPYEDLLRTYHESTDLNMCSFLKFNGFNWTEGGLIQLNYGLPRPLQYAANAAFIASLYVDYMKSHSIPGWKCGDNFASSDDLLGFATSQVNYILGANPMKMSYLVGYGETFPLHVHHRAASVGSPRKDNHKCKNGWESYKNISNNPYNITGAMVGGPYEADKFEDVRWRNESVEPTLAANAGLVAALVSLTIGEENGVDRNTIFTFVKPVTGHTASPPPPWSPWNN